MSDYKDPWWLYAYAIFMVVAALVIGWVLAQPWAWR